MKWSKLDLSSENSEKFGIQMFTVYGPQLYSTFVVVELGHGKKNPLEFEEDKTKTSFPFETKTKLAQNFPGNK
jgi:hypothetical protein